MKYRITLFFLVCILFISCLKKESLVDINPPPTPMLTSDSIWGIANKQYLCVLQSPHIHAEIISILRKGDIVEILSKINETTANSFWFEIQLPNSIRGWVSSEDLAVYDSKSLAETAKFLFFNDICQ